VVPSSGKCGSYNAVITRPTPVEPSTWQARLPLAILACGLPASGKSYLVRTLSDASGLPRVSSDAVRKQVAANDPNQTLAPEHFTPAFNVATYSELGRVAAVRAGETGGVVVDAAASRRAERRAFASAFGAAAPLLYVECVAPLDVLALRATGRERARLRSSETTVELVRQAQLGWEPLEEVDSGSQLKLMTDRPAEQLVAEVVAMLDVIRDSS
jgi:predicted kinase